jgi:hypothetical protein
MRGRLKEAHVVAFGEYRQRRGCDGLLCVDGDAHPPSEPARRPTLEVVAVNHVDFTLVIDRTFRFLPSLYAAGAKE